MNHKNFSEQYLDYFVEMEFNQNSLKDVNDKASPSFGNRKGDKLDSAEQKKILSDHFQTIINRIIFYIVYWGILQIAFIFFFGILYIMNTALWWKKTVMNGKNLS